jgi:hypothetical protein
VRAPFDGVARLERVLGHAPRVPALATASAPTRDGGQGERRRATRVHRTPDRSTASSTRPLVARPALTLRRAALSPLAGGRLLRLDLHPADFDRPRHVLALESVLRRADRRTPVTYDDLCRTEGVLGTV